MAVNKCDLPTADPLKIKTELTQHDLLVEELGGDVLAEEISAKTGDGVQALLDKVKLQVRMVYWNGEEPSYDPARKII